jgi:hypothetical protein
MPQPTSAWVETLDHVTFATATLVATPLLAFFGALLGVWASRRTARELDRWRQREETMRMLRWGVEMATGTMTRSVAAGVTTLDALLASPLVDPDDIPMVRSIADHVAAEWLSRSEAVAQSKARPGREDS